METWNSGKEYQTSEMASQQVNIKDNILFFLRFTTGSLKKKSWYFKGGFAIIYKDTRANKTGN